MYVCEKTEGGEEVCVRVSVCVFSRSHLCVYARHREDIVYVKEKEKKSLLSGSHLTFQKSSQRRTEEVYENRLTVQQR